MTKFKSLLRKFHRSQSGTTAIILAISAVPMMLAAGMGLDFIRASNIRTHMQGALDAAALAAAASPGLSDSQRIDLGNKAFAMNWRHPMTIGIDAKPRFKIEKGGVNASADAEMPTSLMNIAGISTMDVSGSVTVTIPENKKAEIALVLDYSGSMGERSGGQVKYIAMKNAAKSLVTDLKTAAPDRVKIGLVPFSHHVWVTLPKVFVRGQVGAGNWTGCTQDRLYPLNIQDTTPDAANDNTKWGQPLANVQGHRNCNGYVPRSLVVKPLTSDLTSVNAQLDQMQPYDYTNISLGAEFGWHLLSSNAPLTGTAPYSDKLTNKVMVILTDGRQTEPAHAPGGALEPGIERNGETAYPQAEKNLADICEGAKQKGITIMTIAFDLRDDATRDRLRNCSTDPSKHFFVAESGAEVARAFDDIKAQITRQVFVSK